MRRIGSIEGGNWGDLFLASDEASYITGTVLPVGGGDGPSEGLKSGDSCE